MIRLTVHEALKQKGWTAYRLAKEAGLTMPIAYRLADPSYDVRRLDLETFEKVCRALDLHPCKLLDYQPD